MKISCIDIGGTYIKSGVLEDGVLTGVEETPTDGGGGFCVQLIPRFQAA